MYVCVRGVWCVCVCAFFDFFAGLPTVFRYVVWRPMLPLGFKLPVSLKTCHEGFPFKRLDAVKSDSEKVELKLDLLRKN